MEKQKTELDIKVTKLIDLVRKSKKNHEILNNFFNSKNECFGCLFISNLTLYEACELKKYDFNEILSSLDL